MEGHDVAGSLLATVPSNRGAQRCPCKATQLAIEVLHTLVAGLAQKARSSGLIVLRKGTQEALHGVHGVHGVHDIIHAVPLARYLTRSCGCGAASSGLVLVATVATCLTLCRRVGVLRA